MFNIQFFFRLKQLLCFFISAFYLTSFSSNADVPAEVQAVFVNNGCLGCHTTGNTSGGLSLADAATSETELVDVMANCGNFPLVDAATGDPMNSALYRKISMQNPGCLGVMPPSGNLISAVDQAIIRDWIISLGPAAQFGLIEMSAATAQAAEDQPAPSITLMVNRTLGTQGEVSVDFTTAILFGDSAEVEDFEAASGTLTFADGDVTPQTIMLNFVDDVDFEGAEVFSVTLSNPSGGVVLGSQIQTKVTIVDNEIDPNPGQFLFRRATTSVDESVGSFTVEVIRSFGAGGEVSVDVTSNNGSALAGLDYTSINETLTFPEGNTSQMFSVSILEDLEEEAAESFTLTMSNPMPIDAVIGAVSTSTITINASDAPGNPDPNPNPDPDPNPNPDPDPNPNPAPADEAEFEPAGSLFYLPLIMLFFAGTRKFRN